MKKFILFAMAIALIACNSKNDPEAKHQVTFKVSDFTSTTESMNAPRKAPQSNPLMDGEDALTDLYLFDGNVQFAHQESTDPEFGTINVLLTAGEHNLHFVATRSTGLSYNNGILTCTSCKNTFGKTLNLNVSGGGEQNLNLDRLCGKLIITINDAIPTGANQLRIQIGDRYTSLNVETLYGVNSTECDQSINISSKIGNTGYQVSLYMLSPDEDGYETSYTITATNTSNQVIGQATGTMLPIAPNTKTLLSGNLFTGTTSMVALRTSWNADIEVNM